MRLNDARVEEGKSERLDGIPRRASRGSAPPPRAEARDHLAAALDCSWLAARRGPLRDHWPAHPPSAQGGRTAAVAAAPRRCSLGHPRDAYPPRRALQAPSPRPGRRSAPLPPAITEKKETDEDLAAKSETLPRNAFDRSSSFSQRFRKSMTKFVGKKKGNKEAPEEKVEKATEEATAEKINIEQEKEGDFKSTQQKARADFFKEMYTADEKIDVVADVEKEENNVESEDKETKNEED